mgnify:CR=1 FL=1
MKKYKVFSWIILIAIVTLPACDIMVSSNEPESIDLRLKSAEIIEADQQFAFELFSKVCTGSDEVNVMISPLSVSYALGMTYNGASGTTLDAFVDVLHFNGLTSQEINESYKDLVTQIASLDDNVELGFANSIWYRDDATVFEDFISVNQEYFDAEVAGLDFENPNSVDIINSWIEDKTNDKIRDMLDEIPMNTYMYLINAIYFNGAWKYEFDEDETYSGDFFAGGDANEQVDYMVVSGGFYMSYTDDYRAIELPYGDSAFSMVIIDPLQSDSLDAFIRDFTLEDWNGRHTFSSMHNLQVHLPKFSYDFKSLLNDPLIDLGLGIAFSGEADFSKITDEVDLFISRVIHQTYIDVNEKGTEAAAATIVELSYRTAGPEVVKFDSPFMYIIKENSTGAILFMGKVGSPAD